MNVKLTGVLIAVTAILLITCSPELARSPAQVTGRDSPTANATATSSANPATQPPNTPADSAPPSPAPLLVTIAPVPGNLPAYNRDDWTHWTDADGDCQDARQEVLVAETRAPVFYRSDRRFRVSAGEWLAPYTNTVVTDPSKLDVDHMVPLANAHLSGAWQRPAAERERYANHLADPQHLIAVTAGANRSKGARGPHEWRPDDRTYWCQYAINWITIKHTWKLTITEPDHTALVEMLNTCAKRPQLTVSDQRQVTPTAHPTRQPAQQAATPTPQMRTYANCDAAEAAGETRTQGSKGVGRGFPKWMVPSAREGDGDGVVCER